MPTAAGPNTKGQENLVFGYDLGDTKNSFRGEPTANSAVVDMTAFTSDNGCTITPTGELLQGQPVYRVYFPSGTLPRIRFNFAYTTGQQWNGSIYYKVVQSGDYMPQFFFRESGFGSSYASTSFNTDGTWRRANLNYTFSSNGTSMFLLYRSNGASTQPVYIDFAMPQVELNSHATQFTAGTRSATQGLIDITGNSTIDLTNVSFDSNAQMTFDGTSDKVELSEYLTNIDTSVLSLEFVFRTNIGTGTYQPLLGWHYGRVGHGYVCLGNFTGHWGNESISFYNEGTGATPLSFAYTNGHSFLGDTNYHHAVIVLQTGNYQIFVDGEEVTVNASFRNGSQSTVMQSNLFGYGTGPKVGIGVGSQTEGYFNGRIPITKIYNRALTAKEIKANFNAIKGRFNI